MPVEEKKKALIAMSGGVDSSVAASLMVERGYECIGCTMKLFEASDSGEEIEERINEKACCALENVEDAGSVARKLSIPYYVFNFKEEFRNCVIDKFVSCYESGKTPNPCIDCNRFLKFKKLMQRAEELKCDVVVTGHYARVSYDEAGGKYLLKKGLDEKKDQSYVLYALTQEQLAHIQFPLGEFDKPQVREMAAERGFVNANRPDSQDICFVPNGDYASVIEEYSGKNFPPGDYVDLDGNPIGKHKGIIHYTIGQHKGLGVAFGEPRYVCAINPKENTVALGRNEDLFSVYALAGDFNWISGEVPKGEIRCRVKVRYKQKEQPATVKPVGEDRAEIIFDEPQRAITAGQAAVLYDGDVVLGGGTIL